MVEFKTAKKELTIEGLDNPILIENTLFLGRETLQIALTLGKLIAPFVKCMAGIEKAVGLDKKEIEGEKDPFKDLKVSPEFFKLMAEQLISTMDEKKVLDLVSRLVKGTRVNNQEIAKQEVFDIVFQGDIGLLLEVLRHILESNFSSFFRVGGLGNIVQRISMLAK